jgi:Lrp/AsnC family transcriptional regulator for asnA, asnC and gidA
MTSGDSVELDSLDLKLMMELEVDARQTYKGIANDLNISRSTVACRIQQLLDNNIIRIICWVDPLALGYKLVVSFGISTQPGQICNVANRLAACPSVLEVNLCSGRFDIIAWALFRDNEELINYLSNELGSISGILQIDKMLTLREVKVSSRLLKNERELHHVQKITKELDDLDILIVRKLQINPRQRPGVLAHEFGLDVSTIRRRIQRLVEENVIRIIAVIDPSVLGYECPATIGIKCKPDKIREVAEAVASYNNILYVSICAGRYDIDTYGMFRKLSDLENFITVELGSIPGLIHIETAVIHNVVKTIFQIPV